MSCNKQKRNTYELSKNRGVENTAIIHPVGDSFAWQ